MQCIRSACSASLLSVHCSQVAAVLIHPNYDSSGPDSDLAVLKLLDKARISEHIMPVCLPRLQGGEVTAQQGYATDWSMPEETDQHAVASARTGLIELRDVLQCERQYSHNRLSVTITDNMLCGHQHPLSPSQVCYAVTGGVLVAQSPPSPPSPQRPSVSSFSGDDKRDNDEGVWELVGLVSFGYEQRKCSPELYTIYTRLNNFKDWIEKNMK